MAAAQDPEAKAIHHEELVDLQHILQRIDPDRGLVQDLTPKHDHKDVHSHNWYLH